MAWSWLVGRFIARSYRSFLVTLVLIALVPTWGSWSDFVVRSGSMEPGISRGDVVVAQPFDAADDVPLGRVVIFRNPAKPGSGELLVHRIVERLDDGRYATAGDANPSYDATPITGADIEGRARLLVPLVGHVVVWVREGRVLPLAAWLLITTLAFGLARKKRGSRRHLRRPRGTGAALVGGLALVLAGCLSASGADIAAAAFSSHTVNPSNAWAAAGDLHPPLNHLSVTPQSGGAALVDSTVFFRGVASGSFVLENRLTDSGSGPASSSTTALRDNSAGFTHAPTTATNPAGGPYVSGPFAWGGASTGSAIEDVTGTDVAGNAMLTTLTFVNDSAAPSPGSVTYPDGDQTATLVTVSFTEGADAGAGIGTSVLQRSTAATSGASCAAFGAFTPIGVPGQASPYGDSTVTSGSCYRYRLVVTDRVGNERIAVSPHVVRVLQAGDGGPLLATAQTFSILGGTGVVNGGPTTLTGDLGVYPSDALTGFETAVIGGTVHRADAIAAQAQADFAAAYADADSRVPTTMFAGDQNGHTFYPGVHHTDAAFALTGTLTLDGQGDPNALFIFQVDAALNTAAASRVVLVNGAQASHVYWQSLGAAGTGAGSTFSGTILAQGAVTLGAGSTLIGRALSIGTITLANNTVITASPGSRGVVDGTAHQSVAHLWHESRVRTEE